MQKLSPVAACWAICACLACAGRAAVSGPVIPEDWKPADQADLKAQIENAPKLKFEELGTAVYGIDDPNASGSNLVLNPDGKSYDVLLWYRKAYQQETKVYVVDLGTGKVTMQDFREVRGIRMEQGFTWWGVTGFDGKLYGANPDWTKFSTGGAMNIYQYDPGENKVNLYKVIEGYGGESNPLVLAPNGWIYGAGTWCGQGDTHRKASAYGFNPATGEVRHFNAVGPQIPGTGYGKAIAACDTHLYVACGTTKWFLTTIEIATGKQEVILTAPEGGDMMYVNGSQARYFGGGVAWTQQGVNAPKQFYWLYHGKAIPKKGKDHLDGWDMDETCPWPKEMQQKSPYLSRPTPPELFTGRLDPDADKKATLWWRPGVVQPEGKDAPKVENKAAWQKVVLEDVQEYPLTLHRWMNLPDGRLFGTGDGYKGRFLFDPKTDKITPLGRGGGSLYCIVMSGDKLYWSGYPSGPVFEFDPSKPWTLEKGGDPGTKMVLSMDTEAYESGVNPRRVHKDYFEIFKQTRVKKMLSATAAADGRLYFGGKGQRDYEGGGLSWCDPKTGEVGGMWKPFDRRDIGWVTTAAQGRYVVIGCDGSKGAIYDTQTRKLCGEFEPVAGAARSGIYWEVAPGRLLGITYAAGNRAAGVLFGVEIPSGKVLWRKPIPYGVDFEFDQGIGKWDFQKGPDGFIWATIRCGKQSVLARIDPRDATVHVLGSMEPAGKIAFVGRDLYMAGTVQIRRLKNAVPEKE
jgi:hypothetical protein